MTSWKDAPLVALDLEGSGAQNHDDEAILEISIVPIIDGRPSLPGSYTTLINPGHRIPRRPWISPGLTTQALSAAPPLTEIEPELTARLTGKVLVGHNVGVDWRLLHRRCPTIQPDSLIDTLRLARHLHPGIKGRSLTTLLDRYQQTDAVTALAPASQLHRALWDTIGTAMLLSQLISQLPDTTPPSLDTLKNIAGHTAANAAGALQTKPAAQLSLLDT